MTQKVMGFFMGNEIAATHLPSIIEIVKLSFRNAYFCI